MGIYRSLRGNRVSTAGRLLLLLALVMVAAVTAVSVAHERAWADGAPGTVSIGKTAEWVDTAKNIARVTLSVEGVPARSRSDIVLVLDRSQSMWGEKLGQMKAAAKEFVHALLDNDVQGLNQIAVVSYATDAGGATTDASLTGRAGIATLTAAIDGLAAGGGTNIQAGIQRADGILQGGSAGNRVIVLLSDGQPTQSYYGTAAAAATASDWGLNYPNYQYYQQYKTGPLDQKLTAFNATTNGGGQVYWMDDNDATGHGAAYTVGGLEVNNHGLPTISQALISKHHSWVDAIYTVGFDLGGIPEAQFVMKYVASSPGKYYATANNLSGVFAEIAGSIIAAGRDAVVEDTMGYGSSPGYEWELIKQGDPDYAAHPITASRGTYALSVVAPNPPGVDKITWDLGTITEAAATLTYHVRLRPTSLFSTGDMPLDTNKKATLFYEDYLNQPAEKTFTVPALGCPLASMSVVKTDEEANPLAGAGFSLYSDEACTVPVAAEQFVNANAATLFAGMVRGNTYYMKETTAPPDCLDNPSVYKLVVDEHASVSVFVRVGDTYQPVVLVDGNLVIENVLRKPALSLTKKAEPATYDAAGQTITYSYVIKNTGNVTLDGPFTVKDDKATVTVKQPADGALSPGESTTATATYSICQEDLDAGSVTNKATASNGKVTSNEATATVSANQYPALEITKDLYPAGQVADVAGEGITYAITVQNTGNRTLTGVTVIDPFATGGIVRNADIMGNNDSLLEVGEVWSYTATHIVTQAEIDAGKDLVNVATADSDQTGPATDDATVRVESRPLVSINKTVTAVDAAGNGIIDHAGEVTGYRVVVTNTGNVSLTGTLADSLPGISAISGPVESIATDGVLAPGETWTYTYTYTVTQADIDGQGGGDGHIDNTATFTPSRGEPRSDSAEVPVTRDILPEISVEKTAGISSVPATGANVDFTFVVTNRSDEQVTLTSLKDSVFGELLSGPVKIAARGSYKLTITRWIACGPTSLKMGGLAVSCPVPACTCHYNKVAATAYDDQGNKATATDDARVAFIPVPKPGISVTKTASACSVPATGGNVSFTFVVTNKGQQAVTLTSLCDSVFGELLSGPVTIAPQGSYKLTITRWIACGSGPLKMGGLAVSCPVPACTYHYNKVTATAYDDQGNKATATDDATVRFTYVKPVKPSISVTKTASRCSVPRTGGYVSFTFVVTNNGPQAVRLTSLRDSVFGELLSGPVTIVPQGSYKLTITRWIACGSGPLKMGGLAVSCPVPACRYHYNKVTAVACDNQGGKATATDDAWVMFTNVAACVEGSAFDAQTAGDPQAAVGPQGDDGSGAAAGPEAVAPAPGNVGPAQQDQAPAIGDSREDPAAKGFPYYSLLALPAVLVMAAAGLLVRHRIRAAGAARGAEKPH